MQIQEPEEEEDQGDWAEALYEYSSAVSEMFGLCCRETILTRSQDAGDLNLEAGQHVLITEKTSDDW